MDNYILKRVLVEDGIMYYPVVLPDLLRDCVLMLAHDKKGHNGALRVYNSIRRLYYWKGMKKQIRSYCSRCITCAKFNTKAQEFVKSHFTSPLQPMEFISMDLIGEFSPPSSQGHRYALTAVCMLTSYTWCIPLKNKTANKVVNAYIDNIYCLFGPSKKILTDKGTEFKNKLWKEVFDLLRIEHRFTPVYSPQCNGKIEGFNKFLKATIGKQMQGSLEWDSMVSKATAAYNFFPTQSSKHAPFFLMFDREAAVKHIILASESPKYLGMDDCILNVKLLQKLYHIVGYNLAMTRTAKDTDNNRPPPEIRIGTNVLVKDHTAKAFQPKFKDYCVVDILGTGRIIVKDNHGKLTTFHRRDVKPIDMDIKIAEFFEEECQNFRTRDANHIMPKTKIPDLTWENWTPATVNDQDKLAVAKGQVENLECHCIECSPEIEEINTAVEIAEIITPPVQEKLPETPTNTHNWNPITSFYRNFFPYSFEED